VIVACGVAGMLWSSGAQARQLSVLATLLGMMFVVPALVRPVSRVGKRLAANRALPRFAFARLGSESKRTGYTVALVMLVLALVMGVATTRASLDRSMRRMLEVQFGSDLQVRAQGTLPQSSVDDVERIVGVRRVAPLWLGRVTETEQDYAMNLIVIDPASFFDVAGYVWIDGDDQSSREALRSDGVLLPSTLARTLGAVRGDELMLSTTEGPRPFTVGGIFATAGFGTEIGAVVGIDVGRTLFNAVRPATLYLDLAPDADGGEVEIAIHDELEGAGAVTVESGHAFRESASRQVATYFALFFAVLLVLLAVGTLGIANTLTLGVLQRVREIGLLRALGASPGQTARMLLLEGLMLGITGFALAVPLGLIVSRALVDAVGTGLGFELSYRVPWAWIPVCGLLAVVATIGGTALPARRAATIGIARQLGPI
jgi:putative ABC transport system permease protein